MNTATLHPNQQDILLGDQNGMIHVWSLRSDKAEVMQVEAGASVQSVAVDAKGEH